MNAHFRTKGKSLIPVERWFLLVQNGNVGHGELWGLRREESRGTLANVDTGPVHSAVYSVTSVPEAQGRRYVVFTRVRGVVSDTQRAGWVRSCAGLMARVCLHHHAGPACGEEGDGRAGTEVRPLCPCAP